LIKTFNPNVDENSSSSGNYLLICWQVILPFPVSYPEKVQVSMILRPKGVGTF